MTKIAQRVYIVDRSEVIILEPARIHYPDHDRGSSLAAVISIGLATSVAAVAANSLDAMAIL